MDKSTDGSYRWQRDGSPRPPTTPPHHHTPSARLKHYTEQNAIHRHLLPHDSFPITQKGRSHEVKADAQKNTHEHPLQPANQAPPRQVPWSTFPQILGGQILKSPNTPQPRDCYSNQIMYSLKAIHKTVATPALIGTAIAAEYFIEL